MCAGGDRRKFIEEKWPLWLLTVWSFMVNIALLVFAIMVSVKAQEFKPTESPIKEEDTKAEDRKDFDEANLVRVIAYIVSVILLGELVVHVLLVVAQVLEKTLKPAPQFVVTHVVYQILMQIMLCTLLIFDFLSLLHPFGTEEKVIFALLVLVSIIRRALSLILFAKYYSKLRWPEVQNDVHQPGVLPSRPLGQVDYVDTQPRKTAEPKIVISHDHAPFHISSHFISPDFYDGRT